MCSRTQARVSHFEYSTWWRSRVWTVSVRRKQGERKLTRCMFSLQVLQSSLTDSFFSKK